MPQFVALPSEGKRVVYLNVTAIRVLRDHPDEDGVVVEFDETHKVYLGRDQARPLLKLLRKDDG